MINEKFLEDYVQFIHLNANDTFSYACGDCTTISIYDIPALLEVERRFGYCGVVAFQAHLRKENPIRELITDKYKEARKYLESYISYEELDVDDKVAWDSWWEKWWPEKPKEEIN